MALPNVVREPAGEPEGALILVHGRGADEHDLSPLFDIFDPHKRLACVAPGAPHDHPEGGRSWYAVGAQVGYPEPETFLDSVAQLGAFLDGWLADRGIPWERTIQGGFSQGTAMSYGVALGAGRPSPAGILAMSGFFPIVDGWTADLASRPNLPVCVVHGELDAVISSDFGVRAAETLRDGGLAVEEHYSQAGHHIDPRLVPAIADWINQRR